MSFCGRSTLWKIHGYSLTWARPTHRVTVEWSDEGRQLPDHQLSLFSVSSAAERRGSVYGSMAFPESALLEHNATPGDPVHVRVRDGECDCK